MSVGVRVCFVTGEMVAALVVVLVGNGEGVGKNPTEAVKGYRFAADQGDAGAQCYLGCCYENGRGVKKDYSKALDLYQQALNNGCEDAKERIRVLNLLHGR